MSSSVQQHPVVTVVFVLMLITLTAACASEPADPATPLPAATARPAPTVQNFPTANAGWSPPALGPVGPNPRSSSLDQSTVAGNAGLTPSAKVLPTPLPLPSVSLEYGGRVYPGWRGSYCWPTSPNSTTCADSIGWGDFDSTPPVVIRRGEPYSIVISAETQPQTSNIGLYTIAETSPTLKRGDRVLSITRRAGQTLDVPEGTYYLSLFATWPQGDVSYGFKVHVME